MTLVMHWYTLYTVVCSHQSSVQLIIGKIPNVSRFFLQMASLMDSVVQCFAVICRVVQCKAKCCFPSWVCPEPQASQFKHITDKELDKLHTAVQRQKYVGSAGALLPGKSLRVRKVFSLNILLSIISGTCLENHWSFWKVSGLSGKFPDCLERFWIVWKVSVLSGNFSYSV